MSCDGFKLVTPRRRGRKSRKSVVVPPATCGTVKRQGDSDIIVNIGDQLQRICNARNVIDESAFAGDLRIIFQQALDVCGGKTISEIICYGLGHFAECNISRFQLALLLSLKERYQATVYAHDPAFHICELKILQELGFSIIDENEEGKRELCTHGKTLMYLPHCPKQLVNNFLWKNWGPELNNCIIFGNSFATTVDRTLLSDSILTSYLEKIQPYTEEFPLENNFKFLDVFNDTSIHVFPESKLSEVLPSFWTEYREEPVYPESDVELIVKKQ